MKYSHADPPQSLECGNWHTSSHLERMSPKTARLEPVLPGCNASANRLQTDRFTREDSVIALLIGRCAVGMYSTMTGLVLTSAATLKTLSTGILRGDEHHAENGKNRDHIERTLQARFLPVVTGFFCTFFCLSSRLALPIAAFSFALAQNPDLYCS